MYDLRLFIGIGNMSVLQGSPYLFLALFLLLTVGSTTSAAVEPDWPVLQISHPHAFPGTWITHRL